MKIYVEIYEPAQITAGNLTEEQATALLRAVMDNMVKGDGKLCWIAYDKETGLPVELSLRGDA